MRRTPLGKGLFSGDRQPLGLFVWEFATPGLWPLLAPTGIDFGVIDMEHSAFSYGETRVLLAGARSTEVAALVRVSELSRVEIGRALDLGADGVIAPRVSSGKEAADLVRYARFHPLGRRNVAFGCAHDDYGKDKKPLVEIASEADAGIACIALVETREGVEAIEEIVATPGIDAIWVGFADLSQDLGAIGDYESDAFRVAEDRLLAVCASVGMPACVVAPSAAQALAQRARGYRGVALGTDVTLLQSALSGMMQDIESVSGR